MLLIEYPKCSTCRKAKKWLDEHHISYELRDIKEENPSYEELAAWHQRSGLPLRFYQVIAPDNGGYFIFQGLVGSNIATEYLPEFRRLTASFSRRQPTLSSDRGPAAAH